LAVLSERPDARGLGVDASPAALAIAAANAEQAGLEKRAAFAQADWTAPDWAAMLPGPFDLVVANPPYIETETIATLAPEVALAEPRLALDGGSDGLAAYRHILPALRSLAKPGGGFALETGRGQAATVAALAEREGLRVDGLFKDLSGVDRVVYGRRLEG
jgi:release factor glutamine methyltransferase